MIISIQDLIIDIGSQLNISEAIAKEVAEEVMDELEKHKNKCRLFRVKTNSKEQNTRKF